ncbi:hypothetical protein, partial [Zhongshania sp.]|uniref:hypothetical protein n=1 Tax=Zhongshania sp. TaxID=1971902 RepID=UPI003561D72C
MNRFKDQSRSSTSGIALALSLFSLPLPIYAGPVKEIINATGLLEPIGNTTGLDINTIVTPADNLLTPSANSGLQLNAEQLETLRAIDSPTSGNPAVGNNGNDKPVGNAQGKKPKNKSPIESISAPLGRSLAPLVDTIDENLDPVTNPIDDQLIEQLLDAAAPVIEPALTTLAPATNPVDGIVSDLTGGSLEDAASNNDYNHEDGNGAVNDLLGNGRTANSGREAGEASPLPLLTRPLGQAINTQVNDLDEGLDPITDVVDDQIFAPLLDAGSIILAPILNVIEPGTDPIDGALADLTGGSLEDALTNNDDNTADGDGVINDLLGGDKNRNKPPKRGAEPAIGNVGGTGSNNGNNNGNRNSGNNRQNKPVGNAQGKKPKNNSPIESVSAPLGHSATPLIDTADEALDPVTDTLDAQVLMPVIDAAAPATDPVLAALAPATNPVDGIVSDLTGGSLEEALTSNDYNGEDGNGPINDLLGNGRTDNSGSEAGEASPLPLVTEPVGDAIDAQVSDLDAGLDPITDVVDAQVL